MRQPKIGLFAESVKRRKETRERFRYALLRFNSYIIKEHLTESYVLIRWLCVIICWLQVIKKSKENEETLWKLNKHPTHFMKLFEQQLFSSSANHTMLWNSVVEIVSCEAANRTFLQAWLLLSSLLSQLRNFVSRPRSSILGTSGFIEKP